MIKPEQAHKQLNAWLPAGALEEENRLDLLARRIKNLSAKLKPIAYAIHFLDQNGEPDSDDEGEFLKRQQTAFGKLSAADRKKLLTALHGKLAGDIEHTFKWLVKTRRTYEDEYGSQDFFRSQPSPSEIVSTQFNLLQKWSPLSFYDQTVVSIGWLAEWVGHLVAGWDFGFGYSDNALKYLLAAAIDRGGKTGSSVLETLLLSMSKDHPIGIPGKHVNNTLLTASNPEGWEAVIKLLLAAQRQEGLRQSILEAMDDAHPSAFKQIIKAIVDNNLTRFSSVIQAFNAWFSCAWETKDAKRANKVMIELDAMLDDPKVAKKAINGADPELAFFGLWSFGILDSAAGLKLAKTLAKHKAPEFRFVAAMYASAIDSESATDLRIEFVGDEDLRVVEAAISGGGPPTTFVDGIRVVRKQQFDRLVKNVERQLDRVPKKAVKLSGCVWPWTAAQLKQSELADLLLEVHAHPLAMKPLPLLRIKDFMPMMSPRQRSSLVGEFADAKKWDKQTRATIFEFIADRSADVSAYAVWAIQHQKLKLSEPETRSLEAQFSRTAAGVRKDLFNLLLHQNNKLVLASTERLLNDGLKARRMAGLELLRRLSDDDRDRQRCVQLANAYQESRKKLTKDERLQIDAVLSEKQERLSLDNCLGLMELDKRSVVKQPKKRSVKAWTANTTKLISLLGKLIHDNRDFEFTYRPWGKEPETKTLGEIEYEFPSPAWYKPLNEVKEWLPSFGLFQNWYDKLPAKLKDKDGMGLVRALILRELLDDWEFDDFKTFSKKSAKHKQLFKFLGGEQKLPKTKGDRIIEDVLGWLVRFNLPKNGVQLCLDISETVYAMVPQEELRALMPQKKNDDDFDDDENFREQDLFSGWYRFAEQVVNGMPKPPKDFQVRCWEIERWLDEPLPGATRKRSELSLLMSAYRNKKANLVDVYDFLLGPREQSSYSRFSTLSELTDRGPSKEVRAFASQKPIRAAVDQIVDHLFEIEIVRGEAATLASEPILAVRCLRGVDRLRRLLIAIGKHGFKKNNSYSRDTKDIRLATFTELVESCYPAEKDTPESFAKLMKAEIKSGTIPEERFLQLAFLAPQWSTYVGQALNWPGFDEATFWFMAHMRHVWGLTVAFETDDDLSADADDDSDYDEDAPEKLSRWERIIRERTNLTGTEREDGAIDVAWFNHAYQSLTPKRWVAMADAAKFAASSAQAKRAQLISDVLLNKASKRELVEGIKKRNLKENVRLLGLLPLQKGAKREKELIERYEVLEAYRKYAKKLSSLSRPDALRALEIGMQNLAATAGYPDPMRLQWALEAASTADLAAGPITASKGGVSYTLELDDDAAPILTIKRGEKFLKSLPKTVSKEKKFVELRERAKHVKQQASRVKSSLEAAMCRSDSFTGGELAQLSGHSVLWPQLQRLVLVNGKQKGYPAKRGKALRDYAGKFHSIKKNDELFVAHPHDLLKSKHWPKWQRECFNIERLQPFKQVFRELYVVSAQEKKDKTVSRRYAGYQVNRRQAFALWGRCGWSVDEYENVWKSFHTEDVNVSISFNHGVTTPLEVEGLTLEEVTFVSRQTHRPIKLTDVPARLFSEVMRDLDLIVSVAHVGEVDPEASASTVEMRKTLLAETCQLLSLKNVKLSPKSNHVSIKGSIANYAIHLGSGIVHKQPGGAVCLVPVHSQHRGRMFLPFADNDPRTAEVISKTLMLSRDEEIDDPILLEQIRF